MSIRDILTPDFLENVSKRYEIILFSSACQDHDSSEYFKSLGVSKAFPYKKSRISSLFLFLASNLKTIRLMRLVKIMSLETIIKRIELNFSNNIFDYYRYLNNRFLKCLSFPPFINLVNIFSYFFVLLFSTKYLFYFIKFKPAIFYTAHPYASDDMALEIWARIFRTKTIASVHSWDNLTTKLSMHFKYDKIILWNNIMRDQLSNIYKYPKSSIRVIGVPQFDYYFNFKPKSKEFFFAKYGLDLNKKLLVYFIGHPDFVKNSGEIVHKISQMSSTSCPDFQLWVRVHPGIDEPWYEEVRKINNVYLDIPRSMFTPNAVSKIDFNNSEQEKVANLLYHCDITINSFSTTTLDAVCFDKPVINLAIEDTDKEIFDKICSIQSFYYSWNHYLDIVNSKGVSLVTNDNELEISVNKYLEDNGTDSLGRKKIMSEQIQFTDGKSNYRLACELG